MGLRLVNLPNKFLRKTYLVRTNNLVFVLFFSMFLFLNFGRVSIFVRENCFKCAQTYRWVLSTEGWRRIEVQNIVFYANRFCDGIYVRHKINSLDEFIHRFFFVV